MTTEKDFTNWLPANLTAEEKAKVYELAKLLKFNPVAVCAAAVALCEEVNFRAEAEQVNALLIAVA